MDHVSIRHVRVKKRTPENPEIMESSEITACIGERCPQRFATVCSATR